ncbi:uncharacterized protein LOC127565740 [Drosophila albomicans]|uniref:Uncharacterized protein LOC127565740 n=1 Tax=Drosophila albomicans TaxID=7291 RepID=A0A9C6T8H0_DROAB|nr:uncharacterized protein LOC127565740 [Drosophila albomicans]
MSIVLDVVQKMVLQGVYEFTCTAAFQVFKRRPCLETKKLEDCEILPQEVEEEIELEAPAISLQSADTSKDADQLNLEIKPEVIRPVSLCDISTKNSGPIYPPKTSCMRIARNSYFS